MYVVQLLIPLRDNSGRPFPDKILLQIRQSLTDQFGGVTTYSRSPAEGVWAKNGESVEEAIVVVEVMVDALDVPWWHEFRLRLERELRQEEIVIRSYGAIKL
jgi:hypothetical protein